MTTNDHHRRRNHHARRIVLGVGLFLLGAIALLWGWNAIAVDLFALPPARFKHAVAAEAVIVTIASLFAGVARLIPPQAGDAA